MAIPKYLKLSVLMIDTFSCRLILMMNSDDELNNIKQNINFLTAKVGVRNGTRNLKFVDMYLFSENCSNSSIKVTIPMIF